MANSITSIRFGFLKASSVTAIGVAAVALPAYASALSLTTVDPGGHGPVTSFLEARGVAQPNNWKATLRGIGENPGTTGNPGNSNFWKNTPRSWRLTFTQASNTFLFEIFSSTDWSGSQAMSMTRNNISPAIGQDFIGLGINLKAKDGVVTTVATSSVSFNGNAVPTLNNSLTGSNGLNDFVNGAVHYFDGPVNDFVLKGVTTMQWDGSLTNPSSDRVSFDIKGYSASPVPEPSTLLALGGLAALVARKRRARA